MNIYQAVPSPRAGHAGGGEDQLHAVLGQAGEAGEDIPIGSKYLSRQCPG